MRTPSEKLLAYGVGGLVNDILSNQVPLTMFEDERERTMYGLKIAFARKCAQYKEKFFIGEAFMKHLIENGWFEHDRLAGDVCRKSETFFTSTAESSSPRYLIRALQSTVKANTFKVSLSSATRLIRDGRIDEAEEIIRASVTETPEDIDCQITTPSKCFEKLMVDMQDREDPADCGILRRAVGSPKPGDLTIIGGETGAGKSRLMDWLAVRFERSGRKTGTISLEDGYSPWGDRYASREFGFSVHNTLGDKKSIPEANQKRLTSTMKNDRVETTLALPVDKNVGGILRIMRKLVIEHGCKIIFIDYLQIIRSREKFFSQHEKISDIAGRLKMEAQTLGVSLFLGSQLRRASSNGDRASSAKRSRGLSDLKGSGDVENMSECVIVLFKDTDDRNSATVGKVEKMKTGTAGLRFVIESDANGMITDVNRRENEQNGPQQAYSRYGV